MHPTLIDFGELTLPFFGEVHFALPAYGIWVATAVIVAWLWFTRRAARDGVDPESASQVAFWTLLGGLGGGKLGLLIVEAPYYLASPGAIFSTEFLQAAGVVWTAVLGGATALLISSWRNGLPIGRLLDAAAVPVPLGQAIGRIGCLFAGCCFGEHCTQPWGIIYYSQEAAQRTGVPLGLSLHPTPVYEMIWSLLIVLPLAYFAGRYRRRPGEATLIYFAAYSLGRFFIEFWRGDIARGLWFEGLVSTSQLISLVMAPLALGAWFWLRRRPEFVAEDSPETGSDPDAATPDPAVEKGLEP